MHIVSLGDNLHEMSNPILWENKKKNINMSSAEFAHSVVKVKEVVKIYHARNAGLSDYHI